MQSSNSLEKSSVDGSAVGEWNHSADSFAFKFVSECVVVTADDGTIQYISPNSFEVLGTNSIAGSEGLPFEEVFGWEPKGFPAEDSPAVAVIKSLVFDRKESSFRISMQTIRSEFGTRLITFTRIADGKDKQKAELIRNERYQRLFEDLQDNYFFLGADAHGNVVYVSPSVQNILGFSPDDIVGRPWKQFVDLQENPHMQVLEEKRFSKDEVESRENFVFECSVAHANGSIRRFSISDVPVFDESGNVVGSEALCHDVTERHIQEAQHQSVNRKLQQTVELQSAQLSHIEDRYLSVAEYHSEFLVRWLPNGIRTFVNPAYCKYMRASADDLVGTHLPRIVDPETAPAFQREISLLSPSNPVSSNEVCITREDGTKVWQHWIDHGLFNADNQLIEIQSVGRDVTEQRRMERLERGAAEFRGLIDSLSPRERQVMDLVATGKANKVIARVLDLSVKTVEKHRSSMMRKLRVQSVAELVRGVIQSERSWD